MRKNKYDDLSKEYWTLVARQTEVEQAQRNLGYIELDKPVHRGWNAEYVLRDDVARREDAWLFKAILAHCGSSVWCKDKSFKVKTWKGKAEILTPKIGKLYEKEWLTFIPAAQKLFEVSKDPKDTPHCWKGKVYVCTIPYWYLRIKISKHYVTHYREHNEILEQEDAWLSDKLAEPKFLQIQKNGWGYRWTAPWWYRNTRNRKRRLQHKREIHRFIRHGKDPQFDDNYKDGSYYW